MTRVIFAAIFLTIGFPIVSLAASETNPKPVKVVNDETSPLPVNAQSIVEWRYVGLTTYEDDGVFEFGGLFGVAALHKACAADFGPGARAASPAEALFRQDGMTDLRVGWLGYGDGLIIAQGGGLTDGYHFPHDSITGEEVGRREENAQLAIEHQSCFGYRANAPEFSAAVIDPQGRIFLAMCESEAPAACSAPVAIPATP